MANLPTEDRVRIWRGIMRWYSAPDTREALNGILKADLQAAVNAADAWADSAAASYNSALPTTFRNNATASQKALLLALVILARHNMALLRRLIGEVD